MKKITILVFVLLATILSSCKKNYNCKCTFTANGVVYATTNDIIRDTKSKAKAECEDLSGSSTNGAMSTCVIE